LRIVCPLYIHIRKKEKKALAFMYMQRKDRPGGRVLSHLAHAIDGRTTRRE